MWYVYLLRCADDTLYAGCTNDPPRRLQQHNAGQGAKYTRFRRPVSLVYLEQAGDHGQALRREAALKRLTRKEKLALIAAAPPLSDPPIPTEKKTPSATPDRGTLKRVLGLGRQCNCTVCLFCCLSA